MLDRFQTRVSHSVLISDLVGGFFELFALSCTCLAQTACTISWPKTLGDPYPFGVVHNLGRSLLACNRRSVEALMLEGPADCHRPSSSKLIE